MNKVRFEWVPTPLCDGELYENGERWCLYVVGQHSPGYPKYLGRVCKLIFGEPTEHYFSKFFTEDGMPWSTMNEAAKACEAMFAEELSKP